LCTYESTACTTDEVAAPGNPSPTEAGRGNVGCVKRCAKHGSCKRRVVQFHGICDTLGSRVSGATLKAVALPHRHLVVVSSRPLGSSLSPQFRVTRSCPLRSLEFRTSAPLGYSANFGGRTKPNTPIETETACHSVSRIWTFPVHSKGSGFSASLRSSYPNFRFGVSKKQNSKALAFTPGQII
jgi:hypothetical protein